MKAHALCVHLMGPHLDTQSAPCPSANRDPQGDQDYPDLVKGKTLQEIHSCSQFFAQTMDVL